MQSDHPHIEKPAPETTIWRYIDLERFISLLHTRSLFLCRLNAFRDPWEGTWPRSVVEGVRANWPPGNGDNFLANTHTLRTANYVNCWHASQSESAALWDLYSGKPGVPIKSSVRLLQSSITDEKEYYIGNVKYSDFDTEPVPQLNMLIPTFLKRKSFEHEREIRVLHCAASSSAVSGKPDIAVESHSLAIDPNVLLEQLYIAPSSPAWLTQSVQELCRRFDLSVNVKRSSLYDPHVY